MIRSSLGKNEEAPQITILLQLAHYQLSSLVATKKSFRFLTFSKCLPTKKSEDIALQIPLDLFSKELGRQIRLLSKKKSTKPTDEITFLEEKIHYLTVDQLGEEHEKSKRNEILSKKTTVIVYEVKASSSTMFKNYSCY